MIIIAKDGNAARGFRPFSDRGALAHFIDSIPVGESKIITRFAGMKGEDIPYAMLQCRMSIVKPKGGVIRTQTTDEGLLVERVK